VEAYAFLLFYHNV
jgi:prepilin-type N-terminal cleavage/methylation domain-containing protein